MVEDKDIHNRIYLLCPGIEPGSEKTMREHPVDDITTEPFALT